jgi:putative hydrolase of the HAD superfamily
VYACAPNYGASAFELAFQQVFRAFASRDCWEPTAGTAKTMALVAAWRRAVGPTAILSNFDHRLHGLLDQFDLGAHFDVVAVSAECGWEKPELGAFDFVRTHPTVALPAGRCIHVGNSAALDVEGALAAGWRAVGVGSGAAQPGTVWIPTMSGLAAALAELGVRVE